MAQLDLVVEGTLCKQVYPKTAIAEPGTFAIFSVSISKIVQGTIDPRTITKWNNDDEITFKGSVPELRFGTTYRIGAKLVEEYISYLAEGIVNIINIFQPEIITIGGGVCNEKEYLTKPLIEIVEREQYTRGNEVKTKVVTATLGNDAGIIGAAGLGR